VQHPDPPERASIPPPPAVARRELRDGVVQFQSPLWQTNSVLVAQDGEVLLCDPALSPGAIASIRDEAAIRGALRTSLLVTHADFDHICGIPAFPTAEVIAGEDTAARIRRPGAEQRLGEAGAEWGMAWELEGLRCDRAVDAGSTFACGPFDILAIGAPSHGVDGLAYFVTQSGVLLPGDHLSAITYPFVLGDLSRAQAATRALLDALDALDVRWVVPGHGPALSAAEAIEIGRADLRYLTGLEAAAREAGHAGLSPGHALLHAFAVEPPRPTTPDFEIYDIRAANARQALAQAGAASPPPAA
jgi:glyoxylase-like metal-dependent hydrolase (beta-lactamase superfamily II)